MKRKPSGYEVGALMYCPANAHKSVADALRDHHFPAPFSLAFCLEDTIREDAVEAAEVELYHTLKQIQTYYINHDFYLPLLFIRVRSPQQLKKLAYEYKEFADILCGFILPAFFIENCEKYTCAIQQLAYDFPDYVYMPVFESPTMIDLQQRYENLADVKAHLDAVSDKILNIRVGGNDFSHAFGLRRPVTSTIYDLKPVAGLLIDVVTTFATKYVVSGPVWEYYAGSGWDDGLRREIDLDLLNGFVGKTVIHPNQIPVVNEMLMVTKQDLEDARSILGWDENSHTLVAASTNNTRMNEYNTHYNWAKKIVQLANIYGVRPEVD